MPAFAYETEIPVLRVDSRRFAKISPPPEIKSARLPSWAEGPIFPGITVDEPNPIRRRRALEALGTGPGDAFEGDLP
jgi:hypothetical protein